MAHSITYGTYIPPLVSYLYPILPSSIALLLHISRMRSVGISITEAIGLWRKIIAATPLSTEVAAAGGLASSALGAAFAPFLWRGVDYLVKMFHDTDFITELPGAVSRREGGGVSRHSASAFSISPPFLTTTTTTTTLTTTTTIFRQLSSIHPSQVSLSTLSLPRPHSLQLRILLPHLQSPLSCA